MKRRLKADISIVLDLPGDTRGLEALFRISDLLENEFGLNLKVFRTKEIIIEKIQEFN